METGSDLCELIAGRTGQAYNRRKNRHGGYRKDRYHATAVDSVEYLGRCLTCIDLTVARDCRGRVSGRLKKDFEDRPNPEFLEWHSDSVYLG